MTISFSIYSVLNKVRNFRLPEIKSIIRSLDVQVPFDGTDHSMISGTSDGNNCETNNNNELTRLIY